MIIPRDLSNIAGFTACAQNVPDTVEITMDMAETSDENNGEEREGESIARNPPPINWDLPKE